DPTSFVNIEENSTNYVVTVSMPGFTRTNINVNISGRILTIEAGAEKQAFINNSRSDSANCFKTQIMLPNDITGESAQAFYENSILKITIPKKPAGNSLARRIIIM
ncbi:MAG: Hsp20/alpha crystallin family protein, partial [bacterium]|nr:Hsp20/alpha crystallin family protein [bacterium]